ncbi:hypothetical protein G5714_015357 [Onychostoma macrolepis]|uniref:Uncharacterized protein n=1 Tax=Onychostoma macrolepis TaxID=369639 RepID=A0A7J6CAZ2_9TELE|nr:hypothetical protein G5714_015357 [Onychostoma macrolepis]
MPPVQAHFIHVVQLKTAQSANTDEENTAVLPPQSSPPPPPLPCSKSLQQRKKRTKTSICSPAPSATSVSPPSLIPTDLSLPQSCPPPAASSIFQSLSQEGPNVKKKRKECFLQELQHSLSDISDDEASPLGTSRDPLPASSSWSTRQSLFSERWRAERPRLVNTATAQENVATRICQQCGSNPAAVRCCDCRPRPFYCAECDVSMHTRLVLHNRDAMTPRFYQPLPPTTFVIDKALSHCAKFWFYGLYLWRFLTKFVVVHQSH